MNVNLDTTHSQLHKRWVYPTPQAKGQSMMQEKIASFGALKARLSAEKIAFSEVSDVPDTLTLKTRLGDHDGLLHIRWEATPSVVQFVQTIPLLVPKPQRTDVALLLHRLNFELAVLGYTFDAANGIVAYRLQAVLDSNGELAPGMVGAMIAAAAKTVAGHLAHIEQTAGVGIQPLPANR